EDQPCGLVLGLARLEPHPAEAAGAEPRDADFEAGVAEGCVLHGRSAALPTSLRHQGPPPQRQWAKQRPTPVSARDRDPGTYEIQSRSRSDAIAAVTIQLRISDEPDTSSRDGSDCSAW